MTISRTDNTKDIDNIELRTVLRNLVLKIDEYLLKKEPYYESLKKIGGKVREFDEDGNIVTSKIVSFQIVSYGTVFQSEHFYRVHNFCYELDRYNSGHARYFENRENKSLLPIYDEDQRTGALWYHARDPKICPSQKDYQLMYEVNIVPAEYKNFDNYQECNQQWKNWYEMIYDLYSDVNSVLATNYMVKLDKNFNIYSGVFLTFSRKLIGIERSFIKDWCQQTLSKITSENLIPDLYRHAIRQATRAAISQVMARNMSHNLGSHVMSRLVTEESLMHYLSYNPPR